MGNDNKYTGETALKLGNQTYTLLFTWRGFAEIQTVFLGKELSAILLEFNAIELTKLLVIGLKINHPEITEDFILDLNPPPALGEVVAALDTAISRAISGGKSQSMEGDSHRPQQTITHET